MGCENDCALPPCLLGFSAGISYVSGFVLGAWKLLKRGLEGEDLLQIVFGLSKGACGVG